MTLADVVLIIVLGVKDVDLKRMIERNGEKHFMKQINKHKPSAANPPCGNCHQDHKGNTYCHGAKSMGFGNEPTKLSAGKAEWKHHLPRLVMSNPKNKGHIICLGKLLNKKNMEILEIFIKKSVASELARQKEKLAREIEGMRVRCKQCGKVRERTCTHQNIYATSEDVSFNYALIQVAKKVRSHD